jgi:hypothetical protein
VTETELLHLLFQRAPAELPNARLFRRNVGRYKTFDGSRVVHVGVEGQADAYALLRGGRIVEIETKAARGRMRDAQDRWRDFCDGWGISHVVLTASKYATPEENVTIWVEVLRGVFAALTRTR